MAVNRFTNPGEQEYVSSRVPLPLELMGKVLMNKQDQYDKGMANVAAESGNIIGGRTTELKAAALTKQKNADIEAIANEAERTGNYSGLPYKITAYANNLKSSKAYQEIEQDKAMSAQADKVVVEPGSKLYAQKFYNFETKSYNQVPVDQAWSPEVYNTVKPANPQKDFKPYYDQLDDVITQTYGKNGENISLQVLPNGLMSVVQDGETVVASVTKDQLRMMADKLHQSDDNFKALDPFTYGQARHDQLFGGKQIFTDAQGVQHIEEGSKWGKTDDIEMFVNNYLSNKRDVTQTQKVLKTIKDDNTKLPGDPSGKPLDNITYTTIDDLQKSPTNSVKVSNKDQNANWLDAEVVSKTNKSTGITTKVISKDMTDVKAFIGKSNTPSKAAESMKFVENYEYIKAKKAEIDMMVSSNTYKKHAYNNVEYANAFIDEYKIPKDVSVYTSPATGEAVFKNIIDENGVSSYDKLPNTFKESRPDFKPDEGEIVNLDALKLIPGKSYGYLETFNKNVVASAKKKTNENIVKAKTNFKIEQKLRGIDINNPETKKKLDGYSESLESKINTGMALIGDAILTPDLSSDNIFTDKQGNMFSSVFMELTEQQIEKMSIDPDEYPKDIFLSDNSWLDDDATFYKVRINIPAGGNISARVRDMETTKGALTDTGESQIPYKQAQVEDQLLNIQYKNVINEQKEFNIEFKTNKSEVLKSIEYLVDQYEGSNVLSKATAKEMLVNEANNPETLYNLYLFMTDPNKQKLLKDANKIMEDYKSSQDPVGQGKPKAGEKK